MLAPLTKQIASGRAQLNAASQMSGLAGMAANNAWTGELFSVARSDSISDSLPVRVVQQIVQCHAAVKTAHLVVHPVGSQ
jgi:hypothetical protein